MHDVTNAPEGLSSIGGFTQRSAPLRVRSTLGCHGTPFGLWCES